MAISQVTRREPRWPFRSLSVCSYLASCTRPERVQDGQTPPRAGRWGQLGEGAQIRSQRIAFPTSQRALKPVPITLRCSTRPSHRFPTRTGTAPTSWSALTAPDPRKPSSTRSWSAWTTVRRSRRPSRTLRCPRHKLWTGFLDRFGPTREAEIAAFVEVVRGEQANPCDGREALESLRIAEAFELSRRDGEVSED